MSSGQGGFAVILPCNKAETTLKQSQFCGEHVGCYVILLNNSYVDYPAEAVDKWVEIDIFFVSFV